MSQVSQGEEVKCGDPHMGKRKRECEVEIIHDVPRSNFEMVGKMPIIDSGSNTHCFHVSNSMETGDVKHQAEISTASGEVSMSFQHGCGVLHTVCDGVPTQIQVLGAKISDDYNYNVVSVSKLVGAGCIVHFGPDGNYVLLPDGKKIELVAKNGLYGFPMLSEAVPL